MQKFIPFIYLLLAGAIACENQPSQNNATGTVPRSDTGGRLAYEGGRKITEADNSKTKDLNQDSAAATANDRNTAATAKKYNGVAGSGGRENNTRASGNAGDIRSHEGDNSKMRSLSTEAQGENTPLPPDEDSKFLAQAAHDGMVEVLLAKHAQTHASLENVKKFAAQLVEDHTQANQELLQLASSEKNLKLKTDVGQEAGRAIQTLSAKNGKEYDLNFVEKMIEDHKKALSLFKKASLETTNSKINSFIEKTRPVLEKHLAAAEKLQAKMSPAEATAR